MKYKKFFSTKIQLGPNLILHLRVMLRNEASWLVKNGHVTFNSQWKSFKPRVVEIFTLDISM